MKARAILAISVVVFTTPIHADVISDFGDSEGTPSFQGWTKVEQFAGDLEVASAGGHPMAIHARDTCAGCGSLRISAPSEFLGDLSQAVGIAWEEYLPNNSW